MKRKEIRAHYYDYVVEKQKRPKSLKKFLKSIDLSKEDFFLKYESLDEVEADVWKNALKEILKSLKSSEEFMRYSSRERGLAFMYSWFECMSDNRDFFSASFCRKSACDSSSAHLKGFKKELKKFISEIIELGLKRSEFQNRGIQSKIMTQYFWSLFYLNLKSWKKQSQKKSKNKELWMDALIEKSMVFFFDSLAPNLFDTFLDMLKHQRSKKWKR